MEADNMHDSFVTAINTQRTTLTWMNAIVKNMANVYTPGYRQAQFNFQTFLNGTDLDDLKISSDQGKAIPGTSSENIYLEGDGFFVLRDKNGKICYTRLGEFTFDKEGVYRAADGKAVQGYILNDNGEVLASSEAQNKGPNTSSTAAGGPGNLATTEIKLWIDPSNGKYLGKYDEFEFKEDGILYGKADKGKIKVPLYKVAIMNFNNQEGLKDIGNNQYIETEASGKPVAGKGEIRGGLIELSNADLRANITAYQQAKIQMELTNKLISTNKDLLNEAMRLLQ